MTNRTYFAVLTAALMLTLFGRAADANAQVTITYGNPSYRYFNPSNQSYPTYSTPQYQSHYSTSHPGTGYQIASPQLGVQSGQYHSGFRSNTPVPYRTYRQSYSTPYQSYRQSYSAPNQNYYPGQPYHVNQNYSDGYIYNGYLGTQSQQRGAIIGGTIGDAIGGQNAGNIGAAIGSAIGNQ